MSYKCNKNAKFNSNLSYFTIYDKQKWKIDLYSILINYCTKNGIEYKNDNTE